MPEHKNRLELDFQDAISKIEERGDFNRYAEVKPIFVNRLNGLHPQDYAEQGLCYYYLLVSYLKAHLVHETEESIDFFEKMDTAFAQQESVFRKNPEKFSWSEVRDFYYLMDRCYGSLSFLYLKHDFKMRQRRAHEQKMAYRKNAFWFSREFWGWFEYKFLEVTCNYGTSLIRWAITTGIFVIFMAFVYAGADHFTESAMRIVSPETGHWYDYFYFSGITMTTVGYGDIVPQIVFAKILVNLQAFIGFLMLGIFIGLIQKRL